MTTTGDKLEIFPHVLECTRGTIWGYSRIIAFGHTQLSAFVRERAPDTRHRKVKN